MGEQNKLSKQAEELKSLVYDWMPKRKATVHTLRVLAEKLMTHHNNVCIAQVAGTSTSVAGFTLMAVGFGLSFVTFGTSFILTAIGGGISAVGGIATAGSLITEVAIQKDVFDTAQKIINEDREATKAIQILLEEFGKQAQKLMVEKGLNVGLTAASTIKNCVQTSFKLGVRAGATAASEGGEALFRGLSFAGRAAHIGGFAFSAVLLPLDIYTLVTSSMEIDASRKGKKVKEPTAVKKLRELADELAKGMPDEKEFARQISRFESTACSLDSDTHGNDM